MTTNFPTLMTGDDPGRPMGLSLAAKARRLLGGLVPPQPPNRSPMRKPKSPPKTRPSSVFAAELQRVIDQGLLRPDCHSAPGDEPQVRLDRGIFKSIICLNGTAVAGFGTTETESLQRARRLADRARYMNRLSEPTTQTQELN